MHDIRDGRALKSHLRLRPDSNIATQDINSLTSNFAMTSGTNKLASVTTLGTVKNYNNDTNGNLTTVTHGGTTLDTFTYNAANQMATTNWSSGIYATFAYDLTGHRLEKAPTGYNPILYQFNRTGGELLSENDLHHGQVADYIYMDPGRDSRPIAEVTPTTTPALYFTHTDRLGTPQKVTNGSQAVVWSATYAPFGNTVSFSGTLTTQSLRMPGQEFDPESGLNHNGFRYYAGGLTRYIQSDPIGLAAGTNTYQYVKGNPFKFTDRLGLDPNSGGNSSPSQNVGQPPLIPISDPAVTSEPLPPALPNPANPAPFGWLPPDGGMPDSGWPFTKFDKQPDNPYYPGNPDSYSNWLNDHSSPLNPMAVPEPNEDPSGKSLVPYIPQSYPSPRDPSHPFTVPVQPANPRDPYRLPPPGWDI